MHYQSHELGKSLLAPLTAVFQDVQKQLQMELDVERIANIDEVVEHTPVESSLSNEAKLGSEPARIIEQSSNLATTPFKLSGSISPSTNQLADASKISPAIETNTIATRLNPELSPTASAVTLTPRIDKTPANPIASTLLVSATSNKIDVTNNSQTPTKSTLATPLTHEKKSAFAFYQPINLASSQKLFKPSTPEKILKTKKLENSVSTTLLQINPTVNHSSRLPLTAMIGEILGQTIITTDTVLLNDTKKAMPETGEFKPTKAINHAGAQQLFAFSTHNSSVKNSAVSTTLSSNKLAVGLPITPIDKETGQSTMLTSSTPVNPDAILKPESVVTPNTTTETNAPSQSASTVNVFTEYSAQASSNDVTAKQKTAVLLPLRKQTTANASTQASQKISPILPSATANRLEAAVEPALQQAYQVTQQQLQSIAQDSSEQRSSELVRNTFNVSVAMNNNSGSESIDLSDFEQALTDVLRIAARRQGLEV